jgi:hypothetical protein
LDVSNIDQRLVMAGRHIAAIIAPLRCSFRDKALGRHFSLI